MFNSNKHKKYKKDCIYFKENGFCKKSEIIFNCINTCPDTCSRYISYKEYKKKLKR